MRSPFRVFRAGAQPAERLCKKAPHPRAIALSPRRSPSRGLQSLARTAWVSTTPYPAPHSWRTPLLAMGPGERARRRGARGESAGAVPQSPSRPTAPTLSVRELSSRDSGCPPFCHLPCNLGAGVSHCRGAPITTRARAPRGVSPVEAYASRDHGGHAPYLPPPPHRSAAHPR